MKIDLEDVLDISEYVDSCYECLDGKICITPKDKRTTSGFKNNQAPQYKDCNRCKGTGYIWCCRKKRAGNSIAKSIRILLSMEGKDIEEEEHGYGCSCRY